MQPSLHPTVHAGQPGVYFGLIAFCLVEAGFEKQLVCNVQAGMPGLRPTAYSPLQGKDAVCGSLGNVSRGPGHHKNASPGLVPSMLNRQLHTREVCSVCLSSSSEVSSEISKSVAAGR